MPGGSARPRPPRADTRALTTRSTPFPVQRPLFLHKVWAVPRAAAAAPLMSGQGIQSCPVRTGNASNFSLHQPHDKVSVAPGETLTLTCTTSEMADPCPVRWLKGWGSESKTIYDQRESLPRVIRAMNGSNSDFTIYIRNVTREDMGTYYCVKFCKGNKGEDVLFECGRGTEVSVQERTLVPGMVAAAAGLCFLLLLLFIALCMYRRKRQAGVGSPCPGRTVAMGSFSFVPVQCCAGTPSTPSEGLDAESSHLPSQQSSKEENNIHYADLQPLSSAPRRSRSPGTASTEYASLRVGAK
uniref:Ig-like domain-containing protein n=1 Tax=Catharus ustulatus TaxID=91951 RepID=A0A8C3TXI8_CATUS